MTKKVLLGCGHLRKVDDFNEEPAEKRYCAYCRTMEIEVPEYKAQCLTCRIARYYGYNRRGANHMLGAHVQRYPRHVVRLMFGSKVVATMFPSKLMLDVTGKHAE